MIRHRRSCPCWPGEGSPAGRPPAYAPAEDQDARQARGAFRVVKQQRKPHEVQDRCSTTARSAWGDPDLPTGREPWSNRRSRRFHPFTRTDIRGRQFAGSATTLSYVGLGRPEARRVGFGADRPQVRRFRPRSRMRAVCASVSRANMRPSSARSVLPTSNPHRLVFSGHPLGLRQRLAHQSVCPTATTCGPASVLGDHLARWGSRMPRCPRSSHTLVDQVTGVILEVTCRPSLVEVRGDPVPT